MRYTFFLLELVLLGIGKMIERLSQIVFYLISYLRTYLNQIILYFASGSPFYEEIFFEGTVAIYNSKFQLH